MLKQLDQQTISSITANISIPSITDIIKELVDNSLDSKADFIRLEIVEGGTKSILISDNGQGIPPCNLDNLCQRGTTTKLNEYEDVFKLNSYGFRGQALSAICRLCDLSLITKTKDDDAYIIYYNNQGLIDSKNVFDLNSDIYFSQRKAWNKNDITSGSMFIINNVYKNNSLRNQMLRKNTEHFQKEIIDLMQSYIIINYNTNFELYSELKGVNNLLLSADSSTNTFLDRIKVVFGNNFTDNLLNFAFESEHVKVNSYISKDIQSGSRYNKSKATKLYFVNGRKIDNIKSIDKIILDLYQKYNKSANPNRIISIQVPEGEFDINLGERKNEVVFEYNNEILLEFSLHLEKFHEEKTKLFSSYNFDKSNENIEPFCNVEKNVSQVLNTKIKKVESDSESTIINNEYKQKVKLTQDKHGKAMIITKTQEDTPQTITNINKEESHSGNKPALNNKLKLLFGEKKNTDTQNEPSKFGYKNKKLAFLYQSKIKEPVERKIQVEEPNEEIEYKIALNKDISPFKKEHIYSKQAHTFSFKNKQTNSYKELSLNIIEKEDFKKMKIVGQFNKGFIITSLNDSLYIIDQHASDEKINYEHLINNLKIKKQPTVLPIKIDMFSIADLHSIYTNKDLYSQLGFEIYKQNDDIFLTTFPSIYSYVFKIDDFINTVNKLNDKNYQIVNNNDLIKKLFLSDSVLKYIATKACRMSIMIGNSLSKERMDKILNDLTAILSPWNCPHGRPTMRFLYKFN